MRTYKNKKILSLPCLWGLFILLLTGCIAGVKEKQKPISLTENEARSLKNDTIIVTLNSSSRPLTENFMCFNVNSVRVESWHQSEFQQAIKRLHPRMLRLPGGDVANYWNWQRGGLVTNLDNLPADLPWFLRFKARRYSASKLEDYQAGLTATKTKPLFVLNLLTAELKSQLEMLRTAKNLGLPIEYVELGNEFYFNLPNYKKVFPTPQDYAKTAKDWTTAIKQEFPGVKIAVLGVIPKPFKPWRLHNWNKVLLKQALPAADAITLHMYHDHGLKSANTQYPNYPFFAEKDVPIILGEPFRNWYNVKHHQAYRSIPQNKKIWLTEYNLFEKIFDHPPKLEPRVMGSWTHGLYTMVMSMLFLEDPRIEIICNHVLIEDSIFGAIFANKNSFINPTNEQTPVKPFSLSATGSVLRLLGEATAGMTKAQKLHFSKNLTLTGKNQFTYPTLYGWQFSNTKNKNTLVINLSAKDVEIDISNIANSEQKYEQLYGMPQTLVTQTDSLNYSQEKVSDRINLPAYSVTKIDINKELTEKIQVSN